MPHSISQKVVDAMRSGKVTETDNEIAAAQAIHEKYGAKPTHTMIILAALQVMGFGRNRETASALRATADMVECDAFETCEEIEARLDGKSS